MSTNIYGFEYSDAMRILTLLPERLLASNERAILLDACRAYTCNEMPRFSSRLFIEVLNKYSPLIYPSLDMINAMHQHPPGKPKTFYTKYVVFSITRKNNSTIWRTDPTRKVFSPLHPKEKHTGYIKTEYGWRYISTSLHARINGRVGLTPINNK